MDTLNEEEKERERRFLQDVEYMRRVHGYFACHRACLILLRRAPFAQRDLRTAWVRQYVWPTRFLPVWQEAVDGNELSLHFCLTTRGAEN